MLLSPREIISVSHSVTLRGPASSQLGLTCSTRGPFDLSVACPAVEVVISSHKKLVLNSA